MKIFSLVLALLAIGGVSGSVSAAHVDSVIQEETINHGSSGRKAGSSGIPRPRGG